MVSPLKHVLVVFPGITPISREEVIETFIRRYNKEPDFEVFLEKNRYSRVDLDTLDWPREKIKLEEEFNEKLKPILSHNKCQVAFFGVAPIPLTFLLGFLIDSHHKIDIFEKHHDNKEWFYDQSAPSTLDVENLNIPSIKTNKCSDATLRISISQQIDIEDIKKLKLNTKDHLELRTLNNSYDNLINDGDRKLVLEKFNKSLNELIAKRPNLSKLHLFIAAPTGISLLLGNAINSSMHPQVELYQYSKSSSLKYIPCFNINSGVSPSSYIQKNKISRFAIGALILTIFTGALGTFFGNRLEELWKNVQAEDNVKNTTRTLGK